MLQGDFGGKDSTLLGNLGAELSNLKIRRFLVKLIPRQSRHVLYYDWIILNEKDIRAHDWLRYTTPRL